MDNNFVKCLRLHFSRPDFPIYFLNEMAIAEAKNMLSVVAVTFALRRIALIRIPSNTCKNYLLKIDSQHPNFLNAI